MTALFVNDSGEANEKQPVKERKNSKQEMYNYLIHIRKKNIEIIEIYKDKAAEGNPTAIAKCVEARSQNDLIENFIDTFLSSIKEKINYLENPDKDWLYNECLAVYYDHIMTRTNFAFTGRKAVSRGVKLLKYNYNAMREIIAFMKGLVNDNEQRVLDGWRMILSPQVWNTFPKHIQKTNSIAQLAPRMLEIIIIMKDPIYGKSGKTTKVGDTTIINPNQDASKAESERQSKQDDLVNFAKSWLKGSDY